jgi:hypothetical protein
MSSELQQSPTDCDFDAVTLHLQCVRCLNQLQFHVWTKYFPTTACPAEFARGALKHASCELCLGYAVIMPVVAVFERGDALVINYTIVQCKTNATLTTDRGIIIKLPQPVQNYTCFSCCMASLTFS